MPPTRPACSPPTNPARTGGGCGAEGVVSLPPAPQAVAAPALVWCLRASCSLSGLFSSVSHDLSAQKPELSEGSRRDTFTVSRCTAPPHPTPQRSSASRLGLIEEAEMGTGLARAPGRPPRAVPDLGASFCSRKGGNGSEKGSAWSRSPGEEVGVGTRTRALGERLRETERW